MQRLEVQPALAGGYRDSAIAVPYSLDFFQNILVCLQICSHVTSDSGTAHSVFALLSYFFRTFGIRMETDLHEYDEISEKVFFAYGS